MQRDYTFLTDHSYSIRIDYDKLPLKLREVKGKKRRGTYKSKSTNRTVSIDRSSSDKENNSTVPISNTSGNRRKSAMKKKPIVTKKSIPNNKKSVKSHPKTILDASPSLSIEERVKLRRTKPLLTPIKPLLNKKHPIKRIHLIKSKKSLPKPKKFFLGSGLDLDNIVPGNRRRRSVQS